MTKAHNPWIMKFTEVSIILHIQCSVAGRPSGTQTNNFAPKGCYHSVYLLSIICVDDKVRNIKNFRAFGRLYKERRRWSIKGLVFHLQPTSLRWVCDFCYLFYFFHIVLRHMFVTHFAAILIQTKRTNERTKYDTILKPVWIHFSAT